MSSLPLYFSFRRRRIAAALSGAAALLVGVGVGGARSAHAQELFMSREPDVVRFNLDLGAGDEAPTPITSFSTGADILNANGLAFGFDGHIYSADSYGGGTMRSFDGATGALRWAMQAYGSPTGVFAGPDGVYVAMNTAHNIRRYTSDGQHTVILQPPSEKPYLYPTRAVAPRGGGLSGDVIVGGLLSAELYHYKNGAFFDTISLTNLAPGSRSFLDFGPDGRLYVRGKDPSDGRDGRRLIRLQKNAQTEKYEYVPGADIVFKGETNEFLASASGAWAPDGTLYMTHETGDTFRTVQHFDSRGQLIERISGPVFYGGGVTFRPFSRFYSWRPTDLAIGADNKARFLWVKSDSTLASWSVDTQTGTIGKAVSKVAPAGYVPKANAVGPDGKVRVLLHNTTTRQIAIWTMNAQNTAVEKGAVWSAPANHRATDAFAVGPNNRCYVVWQYLGTGQPGDTDAGKKVFVWRVNADTNRGEASGVVYRPLSGVTGASVTENRLRGIAVGGSDNQPHLLWHNTASLPGEVTVTTLSNGTGVDGIAPTTSFSWRPGADWTPQDLVIRDDNKFQLLVANKNGAASVATFLANATGGATPLYLKTYGPVVGGGWVCKRLALPAGLPGGDKKARLLWFQALTGKSALWTLSADGTVIEKGVGFNALY